MTFDLPSDAGALVTLPIAGSRATVVDAFAPTCEPCAKKLPELMARKAELDAAGATLVLVAVLAEDESADAATAGLTTWGVSSPFLVDRGNVLLRELGVRGLPATIVLDAAGHVRWTAAPDANANDVVNAARGAVAGP